MARTDAELFLERIEVDTAFAEALVALKDDPPALHARMRSEGFDASPDEIREVFLERFADQLTEEQLAAVTGGLEAWEWFLIGTGAVVLAHVGLTAAASAAAAV